MGPATGPATSELEQARTAPEFGSQTPLAEKLLAVAIRAQNFTGSTGVAIALTEGQEMVCRASWGTSAPDVGVKLSIDHGFTGLCARTGQPLRCDDAETDPRVDAEACRALGISAIAVSPVRRGLKVVGVIAAFSDTPNAFTEKHVLILTTLSEVIIELLDESQPSPAAGKPLAQQALEAMAPTVALLDHEAVAPAKGVEAAAVFEDDESAQIQVPPARVAPAPKPPSKTPSDRQQQRELPAVVMTPRQASANGGHAAPTVDLSEILQDTTDDLAPIPVASARGAKAEASSSVRLIPLRQPAAEPAPELTFSSYEESEQAPRRWWLLAVILILFALIAWAVSHWTATRSAHVAASPATAPPSPSSVAQPAVSLELKPANSTAPETKHSAFVAAAVAPSASAAPAPKPAAPASKSAAPVEDEDVIVRRVPEAVIETDEPVRRPAAAGKTRSLPSAEAQAPQLALATPELPAVLGKPAPAAPVTAPVSHMIPARLVSRVAPSYPDAARRMNLSGKVVLKATINRSGNVGNLQWVSGNDMFRANALAAVKQWRYKPATLNGQSVDSDLQIVLEFGLPTGR